MWHFYTSHRKALFQLVRSLPMHAATQDQSLMDALANVLAQENHWTRHFGPISGSDPKLTNPAERYVITSFAYGTNYMEYALSSS